jgi:hypothetical protein
MSDAVFVESSCHTGRSKPSLSLPLVDVTPELSNRRSMSLRLLPGVILCDECFEEMMRKSVQLFTACRSFS